MRLRIFPKLLLFASFIMSFILVIIFVGWMQINDLLEQQNVRDLHIKVLRLYQQHTKFKI